MTTASEPLAPLEHCFRWATESAEAVGARTGALADKLGAGEYTPRDVAEDVAGCVTFFYEEALSFFDLMLEIAGSVGCGPARKEPAESEEFTTQWASSSVRTFKITQSLTSPLTQETLPDASVSFDPKTLGTGQTKFRLVVWPSGTSGAAYFGKVTVVPSQGSSDAPEEVDVWVQIA